MKTSTAVVSVVAVAALGGAAYAGSSWWLGQQIEQQYNTQLDQVVAALGPQAKVVSRNYERGAFESRGTLVLQIDLPKELPEGAEARPGAATQPAQFTIVNTVRHGPLADGKPAAAAVATRVTSVSGVSDSLRAAFAKASPPRADTLYQFDGSYRGQLVLPTGSFESPQASMQWQQLDYDFEGKPGGRNLEGTVRWPSLVLEAAASEEASGGKVRMRMDGMQVSFQAERPAGEATWMLAQGKADGKIAKVLFELDAQAAAQTPAPPSFVLNDVKLTSNTTRSATLIDSDTKVAGQAGMGKPPVATDATFEFDVSFKNLDADALTALQAAALRMTDPGSSGGGTPDNAKAAAGLEQGMQRLFAAKPQYRNKLSVTFDGQTGSVGYGITVGDAPAGLPPGMQGMPWPALAMMRLGGDAALRLPKSWLPALARVANQPELSVDSMKAMLDVYKAQGLVLEDAQAYTADVKYLPPGELLVNGKPMEGFGGASGGGSPKKRR